MTVNSLIESILMEIAREYQAGALLWMKRNTPAGWAKLVELDKQIDRTALVITEYTTLIREMIKAFKISKVDTGSPFSNL
jgi:hypothetical protein